MRLIDADAVRFETGLIDNGILFIPYRGIAKAPTVDAEPVVHGHWDEGHEMMTCTNCCEQFDLYFKNDFNYCPNCGAKMEGA